MASPATFDAAADWLSTAAAAASLPNDVKLEIYGIYKVLTAGSEPDGPAPGWLSMPAVKAKYNAWISQGKKYGGDESSAQQRYVEIASGIGFDPSTAVEAGGKSKGGLGGVKVSVMKPAGQDAGVEEGRNPLHDAVHAGDVESCRRIATEQPDAVNSKDDYGMTPLHIAADRGNKRIVEVLLLAGADKAAKDDEGFTARENAEGAEHTEVAELL